MHAVRSCMLCRSACPATEFVCSCIAPNQGCECCLQISRAILGQDQKLRLPKFLEEEEKSPEATKQVSMMSISVLWPVMPMHEENVRAQHEQQVWLGCRVPQCGSCLCCFSASHPVIDTRGYVILCPGYVQMNI